MVSLFWSASATPAERQGMAVAVKKELDRLFVDTDKSLSSGYLVWDQSKYVLQVLARLLKPLSAQEAQEAIGVLDQLCKLVYQSREYSPGVGPVSQHGCLKDVLYEWCRPGGSDPDQPKVDKYAAEAAVYCSQEMKASSDLDLIAMGHLKLVNLEPIRKRGEQSAASEGPFDLEYGPTKAFVQARLEDKCRTLGDLASEKLYTLIGNMIPLGAQMASVAGLERLFSQKYGFREGLNSVSATAAGSLDHLLASRTDMDVEYQTLKMDIVWVSVLTWWKAMAYKLKCPHSSLKPNLTARLTDYQAANDASARLVALAKIEQLVLAVSDGRPTDKHAHLSWMASDVKSQEISRPQLVEYLQSGYGTMTHRDYCEAVLLAAYKFRFEM